MLAKALSTLQGVLAAALAAVALAAVALAAVAPRVEAKRLRALQASQALLLKAALAALLRPLAALLRPLAALLLLPLLRRQSAHLPAEAAEAEETGSTPNQTCLLS